MHSSNEGSTCEKCAYALINLTPSVVVVAQLVEHGIVIPRVAGSSPVDHPKFLVANLDLQLKLTNHINKGSSRGKMTVMTIVTENHVSSH